VSLQQHFLTKIRTRDRPSRAGTAPVTLSVADGSVAPVWEG
jgi:hypothetical protein